MNQIATQNAAHLQGNRRQVAAQSVAGMGTAPTPYISIEGGRFTLVDAEGNEFPWTKFGALPVTTTQGVPEQGVYLDAVLVDVNEHMSKAYYIEQWKPNQQKYLPPVCWSDNGLAPSASATTPQCQTCEQCPHNVWGSRVNPLGNKVKACDDMKKLAWYIPELNMNLVFLMRLKGSSHRNWRDYVDGVRRNSVNGRQADPVDVVTRIYFEPGAMGILAFEPLGLIDATTAGVQEKFWAEKSTDQMVGRLDRPYQGAIAGPQPTAALQHQSQTVQTPATPPPQQFGQPAQQPQTFGQQPVQQPVLTPEQQRIRDLELQLAAARGQGAPNIAQPQNNAPAAAPAGFGGASPLPGQHTPTGAPPQNFGGGHAPTVSQPSPQPGFATASPSDPSNPPSGRPRGGNRRNRKDPNQQPVAQAPQTFAQPQPGPANQGFGQPGQPAAQTFGQPTAPQPQPPNPGATGGAPPQTFGVTAGAPPNAELAAALTAALGTRPQ